MEERKITKNQLRRLPEYLQLLKKLRSNGLKIVSCKVIADCLEINPEKVRKDIALISRISGVPNKGRDIDSLISDIETILGYNMMSNAFLVGAGSLGTALCCYKGFDNYGLSIVGAFDKFPKNIGKKVGNVPLFDIKDLTADAVKDFEVEIGIICVPDKAAQEIADQLVEAGIKAIWNLAPTKISVPRSVIVLNSDLANSLAFLSHELYLKKQKEN